MFNNSKLRHTCLTLLLIVTGSLGWTTPLIGCSRTAITPLPSGAFSQSRKCKTATKRNAPQIGRLTLSSSSSGDEKPKSNLPMLLDIGTKGGALFLSLVLFVIPIIFYQVITGVFGFDDIEAGKWIGVGFTVLTLIGWASTYIFRVATKDMTYAKQLKEYEDAVIAKRLEELDEDEVQALVEDIERDDF
mmetsp:Transcript_48493/g.58712  ORF Transcript_48493/g.58712 Transcript_48493/m.58712 type:complete len:189 (+) Transcript_48493:74-640(+)|eukprot:CAMPEP_0172486464 /NCGR_PEP_ID=MMETSP1066-20121228/15044_1 /TAXON_ID=671091 /ORGANISM="Coscinodiscus wailesii, Strain CCMP2513" /LENGTH=188 /DNA_ID=CAMNT_0013252435 /DNA_START=72 /DNA_END=638 /DNA_ORIENTATION=-